MTVKSEAGRESVGVATGANRNWTFGFRFYANSHVKVDYWEPDTSDWVSVPAANFTLTRGPGNAADGWLGGTITYPKSPAAVLAAGWKLRARLDIPFTQANIDLTNASGFDPRAVEKEYDLAVLRDQQLRDQILHTVRFPSSVSTVPPLSGVGPYVIGVDEDGLLTTYDFPLEVGTAIPSWWAERFADFADLRAYGDDLDTAAAALKIGGVYVGELAVESHDDSPPDQRVSGPGSLDMDTATIGQFDPTYNLYRSSLKWTPEHYWVEVVGDGDVEADVDGFPAATPYYNTLIGVGIAEAAGTWRTTGMGSQAGTTLSDCERTEFFGVGAMRWATKSERNTAIGSISLQWLGRDPATLADVRHDLWYPILPTDPSWDVDGMETDRPGAGLEIAAVTGAASRAECRANVGLGRDTLVHLIKGENNVALGYRALTHAYFTSGCTAAGKGALHNNLFGTNETALGSNAGYAHQTGTGNVYIGYEAGLGHVIGDRNVFVGRGAGETWAASDRSILIGPFAGASTTQGDDLLVINNTEAGIPLISGDFVADRVGINLQPEDIGATFHVRTTASGVSIPVSTAGNSLILEGSNASGMTILTPNNVTGNIMFGDPEDTDIGRIAYNHSTNRMSLWASNATQIEVWAGHFKFTAGLPTSASGLESGEIWIDAASSRVLKSVA